jgi:RHS repeat-associated protein
MSIEQINNTTGTVSYLHHDQVGSTRVITGSAGTVTGKCTYAAYGTPTCEGTATTPLGWDGQYTSSDTGLVYLRNRVYDPSTAQFLSVDPDVMVTRAPYNYAEDNPVNHSDPTGLGEWEPWTESFWTEGNFISNSPLNPIPYYEQEIESFENGCGYFSSVAHGLEGTLAGAALFAGGPHMDWQTNEPLPLLLSDATNSYIYGPGGLPVEQINNTTGTVTYLHHDQAGSTRLITGSTGKTEATFTYGPYGEATGSTGTATTPLGYDGEYTSSDTGLVYMRARVYDSATAQFLSIDPLEKLTRAPYNFAEDNPLNESDPTGLLGWSEIGQAVAVGLACVATDGGCVVAGLVDLDANVISNDYKAATEPCKATEEETTSLTDLVGFGLGAGVGELAGGSLSEEAKKALENTSAGKLALKQLVGLGATSSTLTTLAYAKEHENSSSGCSCQG